MHATSGFIVTMSTELVLSKLTKMEYIDGFRSAYILSIVTTQFEHNSK